MKILDKILEHPKTTGIIGSIIMLVFLGLGIRNSWQNLPEEPLGSAIVDSQNLITNGDFSNGAIGWTEGASWTIASGKATFDDTTGNNALDTSASITIVSGRKYRVSFDILDLSAGSAYIAFAKEGNQPLFRSGTYQLYPLGRYSAELTAENNATKVRIYASVDSGSAFAIDNISIVDITNKLQIDASDLITNGDLSEHTGDDFDDWSEAGITHQSDANFDNFARITHSGSTVYLSQAISEFDVGKTFRLSYWAKTDNVATVFRVQLGAGVPATQVLTTSWKFYSYEQVATGAGALYFINYTNGNYVDITNIKLVETTNKYSTGSLVKGLVFDMPLYSPYTKAGSDLIANGDFSDWTGDDPDDWTVFGEDVSNYVDRDGTNDIAHLVSNGGLIGILQNPFIIGKSYQLKINVTEITSGGLNVLVTGGLGMVDTITATGIHTYNFTATGIQVQFYRSGTTDLKFTDITVKEIDGTTLDKTPYGNDGMVDGATIGTASTTFDGTDDYIDIGNTNRELKTISFWEKNGTIQKMIDLDGGTHYIETKSGPAISAFGFIDPTFYINSVETSVIDSNWNHIVITTNTNFTVNDMDIGRVSTGYFDGDLADIKIWNRVLTTAEIELLYDKSKHKYQ
jgi:hypothetical protein